uniref:Uncharacterized protein n=1 Tax=Meloidogyne enterolobii TaxID=390850 RepID=A0A6V7XJ76_MELEN|nr:unnamed protein product [Meloidogyne enterolobii]
MASLKVEQNFSQIQCGKKKRDFIFDRKYILRHRIDTLKEYTRIQLYLIREEQRNAFGNKESYSNKFKQLMNDFDLEKKKIKMELNDNVDKSKLIDHYVQMFKQQEETRKLIARFKAKQELQFMERRYFEYSPNHSQNFPTSFIQYSPISQKELNNNLDIKFTSRNNHLLNESLNSLSTDVSDGIVSSFKPSEKSLRSILSPMPSTSLGTGRDSLSRRRSSASEALVKLRLMNNVPAISRSPPPIKSPPRATPRSPTERYATKFPQNISARESICNDDILNIRQSIGPSELLEDLPNASQIGMVLDLSHSPIASLSDKELIKKDEYFEEKKCIEKYVKFLWKNFMENGEIDFNSIPEWEEFNIEEGFEDNFSDNFKIPKNLLRQLCYERWLNLIQNTNCLLSSKKILSTEENLKDYLQKEVLSLFVDNKREICPNGIKLRAEKTSHLALDVNRLLLAQYVYENLIV